MVWFGASDWTTLAASNRWVSSLASPLGKEGGAPGDQREKEQEAPFCIATSELLCVCRCTYRRRGESHCSGANVGIHFWVTECLVDHCPARR